MPIEVLHLCAKGSSSLSEVDEQASLAVRFAITAMADAHTVSAVLAGNPSDPRTRALHYEVVALVEGQDLEQAYMLTNHIDGPWQSNPGVSAQGAAQSRARSTSVGDVLRLRPAADAGDTTPPVTYLVASVGFQEVPAYEAPAPVQANADQNDVESAESSTDTDPSTNIRREAYPR